MKIITYSVNYIKLPTYIFGISSYHNQLICFKYHVLGTDFGIV